jgi:phosphoadenosine phosphosulfate reductase
VTKLNLNLFRVSHDLTPGEFKVTLAREVEKGSSAYVAFDMVTKVQVLQAAVQHPEMFGQQNISVVIAGNRRDQSSTREASLSIVEAKNGLLYLYPLADWTRDEIRGFEIKEHLEPHPLAAQGYLSVGNRGDTVKADPDARYEKDGRHEVGVTECGLHLWWLAEEREHIGMRVVPDWNERVRSPRE